jgi:hypothetical protein
MRAIFILLLLANILFFGYQFFFMAKKNTEQNVSVGVQSNVEGPILELLVEQKEHRNLRNQMHKEPKVTVSQNDSRVETAEFCMMIGPYGELLQAEYALEHLEALGAHAHITPIDINDGEIYWVYLKPEASEKEALRRLYELQKKGIESHVIAKGNLANGISFGQFGDFAQAQAKSLEIKNEGYVVEIKMLPKVIQETWVVLSAGSAEKIDESVWLELLTKELGLEKRQNFCLGVASQ